MYQKLIKMGSRTKWKIDFYLKGLRLDNFDKHCEWLHNNELPETDTFCPDCNTQIYDNCTLSIWICCDCFRSFTKKEIIKLSPHSKNCEVCGKRIMWLAEVCDICNNRQYIFGDFMKVKFQLIQDKMDNLIESIFHYKWSYYPYRMKEEQLKEIKRLNRSLISLTKIIKNVDIYFDKIKSKKEKKGYSRWDKKRQNDIKYGIKILKKEREIKLKNKYDSKVKT